MKIEDLQLSTSGTPPEEREGRERMTMTSCSQHQESGGRMHKTLRGKHKIWTDLVEDPEMKVVEEKLREAQEKAQKASESINTLPPVERMMTILAQRQSYVEVENMWDQQKILQQRLGPLQEEALRVIGELATA
jgi:hypothetical protein